MKSKHSLDYPKYGKIFLKSFLVRIKKDNPIEYIKNNEFINVAVRILNSDSIM